MIEALAAGVPVVKPRHAAFPEIVEATGGGILCEPGNPRALADAWETLLADPARARALGLQGREAVHREFTMERMADRFLEVTREKVDAAGAAH
jgi:glycosyltransferase involved in cell wall biosynthesis